MGFKLNLDVNDTDLRKFVKEQIQGAIVGTSRDEIKSLVEEQMKKEINSFPRKIDGILKEIITYALRYSGYINEYSNIGDGLKETVEGEVKKRIVSEMEKRITEDVWEKLITSTIEKETGKLVADRVNKLININK